MIIDDVYEVESEMKRCLKKVDELLQKGDRRMSRRRGAAVFQPGEMTGAVRRASMDLSRALIKLRKG